MRKLGSLIGRRVDARAVRPEPKQVDPFYLTPEYRAWREAVIARAGRRCEDVDEHTGHRCTKAEPRHRMFADHVRERRDAPHLALDVNNGRCRCGSHHTAKTVAVRRARLSGEGGV